MTGTGDCRRDLGLPYAQRGGLCIGLRGIRAIDKHLICTQHIRNLRPAEAPQGDPAAIFSPHVSKARLSVLLLLQKEISPGQQFFLLSGRDFNIQTDNA